MTKKRHRVNQSKTLVVVKRTGQLKVLSPFATSCSVSLSIEILRSFAELDLDTFSESSSLETEKKNDSEK